MTQGKDDEGREILERGNNEEGDWRKWIRWRIMMRKKMARRDVRLVKKIV